MDTTTGRAPAPEDPGRRRELRRRGASYARSAGTAKRQRAALRRAGIDLSLRRLQHIRSSREAETYPGVPQWMQEWIEALARDRNVSPWPYLAGLVVTTAEVEAESVAGCRRRLLRQASEMETRHQGSVDVCQIVLARRWCRETLEELIEAGGRELAALSRLLGLATVALREGSS